MLCVAMNAYIDRSDLHEIFLPSNILWQKRNKSDFTGWSVWKIHSLGFFWEKERLIHLVVVGGGGGGFLASL